jgi:hypothetical protein
VDVAELGAEQEVLSGLGLDRVSDSLDAAGKALKDSKDITAVLHGDDAKLILLIDPDKEGLGIIVEDATALGPVTLHASHLQVRVPGHEEEVVIHKLLADLLIHASERIVLSSKITCNEE